MEFILKITNFEKLVGINPNHIFLLLLQFRAFTTLLGISSSYSNSPWTKLIGMILSGTKESFLVPES